MHGNPPAPPPVAPATARKDTARVRTSRAAAPARTPARPPAAKPRRRTPPEDLEPLILAVLDGLGGEADAEVVMTAVGDRLEGSFRPGDQEAGPTGELRWRTACRTARKHLADQGRLVAPRPGVWRVP